MSQPSFNPYEAPQPIRQTVDPEAYYSTLPGAAGLYREKNLLIVSKQYHVFPQLCAKSGVATTQTYNIDQKFLDDGTRMAWFAVGGLIGGLLAWYFYSEKVKLQIPCDPEQAVPKPRSLVLAIVLAAIGVLLLLGSALALLSSNNDLAYPLLLIGGVIVFIGTVTGVENYLRPTPPFSVKRTTKTHIWLDGVDPRYLECLPTLTVPK